MVEGLAREMGLCWEPGRSCLLGWRLCSWVLAWLELGSSLAGGGLLLDPNNEPQYGKNGLWAQ